jgi:membrane protease YdiL (CAAX protease family)
MNRTSRTIHSQYTLGLNLLLFLAIVLLWKVGKHLALGNDPLQTWRPDQEIAMTWPRLIALAAMLGLAWWWTPADLGWTWRGWRQALIFGTGVLIAHVLSWASWGRLGIIWDWPGDLIILGVMLSVGLYEELAYRGLLYCILDGLGGSRLAVWGTAISFALMHLDNRPRLDELLVILLTGLVFAQIRRSTGSIVGLILVHTLIDVGWWVLRPTGLESNSLLRLASLALLVALVVLHHRRFHSLAADPMPRPIRF